MLAFVLNNLLNLLQPSMMLKEFLVSTFYLLSIVIFLFFPESRSVLFIVVHYVIVIITLVLMSLEPIIIWIGSIRAVKWCFILLSHTIIEFFNSAGKANNIWWVFSFVAMLVVKINQTLPTLCMWSLIVVSPLTSLEWR